jgi:ComF family protein
MIATAKEYLSDFIHLLYPDICLSCGQALLKDEQILCFKCEGELPQTGQLQKSDNRLMQRLWGRVEVQGAAAFLQFQKGGHVQHLLHQMKYKGRKEVGVYLAKMLGHQLLEPDSIIKNVDIVVPVPLHWKKLRQRGYNQCDSFAGGVAEVLGVPWSEDALERVHENVAQARKRWYDRWENVSGIFSTKDVQQIQGKHVLLVDDVVTTGATAEACIRSILTVNDTRASFLAVAYAVQ